MKLISKVFSLFFLSAGLASLLGCNAEPGYSPPTPRVTLTATPTITPGSTIKLSWSSEHVDSCTVTSNSPETHFEGAKPTRGSFETGIIILGGPVNFHIECVGRFYEEILHASADVTTTVSSTISAKGTVPASGGTVSIPNIASALFPANSVEGQEVVVSKIEDKENADLFKETQQIFITSRFYVSPHQIQIEVKGMQPKVPVKVTLNVPETARLAGLQLPKGELVVFYNAFQVTELSRLLTVEAYGSRYDPRSTAVTIEVKPEAFSDDYTDNDGLYVAVLYLGYMNTHTPGAPYVVKKELPGPFISQDGSDGTSQPFSQNPALFGATDTTGFCTGTPMARPVPDTYPVVSQFGPRVHPITKTQTTHWGTDYAAPTGTAVTAVAEGRVELVDYQFNPRSKTGWGNYMVVRHKDNSQTLYAHLKTDTLLKQGSIVLEGDQIAESNASGGVSAPHLHVEYSPNGEIFNKPEKSDFNACVGEKMLGASFYVADNGSAADDAFVVSVDGVQVCETELGGSASCVVGGIKIGPHSLGIGCTAALDGKCTYGITLFNKMRFDDGTDSKSGTSMLGRTVNFGVSI